MCLEARGRGAPGASAWCRTSSAGTRDGAWPPSQACSVDGALCLLDERPNQSRYGGAQQLVGKSESASKLERARLVDVDGYGGPFIMNARPACAICAPGARRAVTALPWRGGSGCRHGDDACAGEADGLMGRAAIRLRYWMRTIGPGARPAARLYKARPAVQPLASLRWSPCCSRWRFSGARAVREIAPGCPVGGACWRRSWRSSFCFGRCLRRTLEQFTRSRVSHSPG